MAFSAGHIFAVSELVTAATLNAGSANTDFLYGDTTWGLLGVAAGFQNSWVNTAGYASGFRKVGTRVYMRGRITAGGMNTAAFTLPVGWRLGTLPEASFACESNNAYGRLIVYSNGNVQPVIGSNVYFELGNVNFDTLA